VSSCKGDRQQLSIAESKSLRLYYCAMKFNPPVVMSEEAVCNHTYDCYQRYRNSLPKVPALPWLLFPTAADARLSFNGKIGSAAPEVVDTWTL
jgi:hypothetical protein